MAVARNPSGLARLPVRVYAAIGVDGLAPVEGLGLDPGIERVASPRHASVLLVAGHIPEPDRPALRRLHDQLPHPRASLYWGAPPAPLEATVQVHASDAAAPALQALQRDLLEGRQTSSGPLLPDTPPAPWRGRGDHGQGGEGMMGGRPYGRPMAMTDEDRRDGLALDACTVDIGPFAPMLPPGLSLQLTLQGDVIQEVRVNSRPYLETDALASWPATGSEPVALATLERRRAGHHLRCIGRLLSVRGLEPLAARAFRAAQQLHQGGTPDLAAFKRRLWWSGLHLAITPGLGVIDSRLLSALPGPVRRAAGEPEDRRAVSDLYRRVGFRPVIQHGGDVRARLAQWLAEAGQSLDLAAALGSHTHDRAGHDIEPPWGAAGPDTTAPVSSKFINTLLGGREWSEAITILASFDHPTLHRILTEPNA